MIWAIVALVWLIGVFVTYKYGLKDANQSMFDRIWLSIVWPTLIPLFIIHYIHNM